MELKTNIYSPKDNTIALYERELEETFHFKCIYQERDFYEGRIFTYTPAFAKYAIYNSKIGKYKISVNYFLQIIQKEDLQEVVSQPTLKEFVNGFVEKQQEVSNSGGSSDYYKLPPNSTELQDLIEFKNMNYAIANIFKACYRYGENHHSSKLRDLEKINWFCAREIARLKKND